jgi:hypothetical protein
MIPAGTEEYKLLRAEMINTRECVTDYMGFTLGSAGVAAISLSIAAESGNNAAAVVVASLLLSLLATCVASIMFYKFNSYNRYAGYCKLLNHELPHTPSNTSVTSLFSWEIVLEQLKQFEFDRERIYKQAEEASIARNHDVSAEDLKMALEVYARPGRRKPYSNSFSLPKGLLALARALVGRIRSQSWGFPPIPAAVLAFLAFALLTCGALFAWYGDPPDAYVETLKWAVRGIAALQVIAWVVLASKLHMLMQGSTTVQSYFWRFMPPRALFLHEHGITSRYYDLATHMKKAIKLHPNYERSRKQGGPRSTP